MRSTRRIELIALLAILALALGLRLYRLDAQSLWNDEGTTVALVQRDLATILQNASDDIHPPLYYIVLHYWVGAFGTTEAAARGLSVLAGVLVVAGTYLLARRYLSSSGALVAAALSAVSPFQVYYAQETRMYIMATLLAIALVAACHELLASWERRVTLFSWEALAVLLSGVALLYTHYFSATILVAVNVTFLVWLFSRRRQTGSFRWAALWRWALLMLMAAAAFVPWLREAWSTLIYWPAVSAPTTLLGMVRQLLVSIPLGITAPEGVFSLSLGALAAVLAGIGLVAMIRRDRLPGPKKEAPWRPWLLASYLALPPLIMYLGSLSRPMLNVKFLLPVTPALHITLAAGIMSLIPAKTRAVSPQKRLLGHMAALLISLALFAGSGWSLHHLYYDPRYARDDYRGIVAYIHEHAGPGAAILINAPSQIETVDYYHDEPPPMYPLARTRPMDITQTLAELEAIVARHDELYGIFWATGDSDPEGVIENWLAEHTFKTMDRWYGNLRLVTYAVPPAAAAETLTSVDAVFGDSIRLRGYGLFPSQPVPDSTLQLTLEWEAYAPIEARYKVFAQLLDDGHQIVGQNDSEPSGGNKPTNAWLAGETVLDRRGIPIPAATPAGDYTLLVGLYDEATGVRLPVQVQGSPAGDALPLTTVTIGSRAP